MPHLCYDPGNSKHCEITSAILGRASGQTKLNKRLFINPHFLNALGLYLPALLYPWEAQRHWRVSSALQRTRLTGTFSYPTPKVERIMPLVWKQERRGSCRVWAPHWTHTLPFFTNHPGGRGALQALMGHKAAFCHHPGLAKWISIQQLVHEAASISPLCPPSSPPAQFSPFLHHSAHLAMQPFSTSLASSAHNPLPPVKENWETGFLHKSSYCLNAFWSSAGRGNWAQPGPSPGPSDGAKLQLSWLAKPALTPLHCPPSLGDSEFSERTVSVLLSSRWCQAWYHQEGRREGGSLLSPTHATSSSSSHTPGVM